MLSLVTDRTSDDVEYLKTLISKGWDAMDETERTAWKAGLKGAYNASDLNRVINAIDYLADKLNEYGYNIYIPNINIDGDRIVWVKEDIPTSTQMKQYLDNVAKIHSVIFETVNLPVNMENLTVEGANQIEQALVDVDIAIEQIIKCFSRSNSFSFWSGNRPFPTIKSNIGRNWSELDAMNTSWRNWQMADWYLLLYGNLKAEGVVE